MRIDAYNQIAQVYKTTSAAKLQKTENARHGRDEVQDTRLLAEIIRSQNRQSLKQQISGKIKSQN